MRTVVTYLDKDNKQANKDEARTVESKVYNDAGNLQRTGYSIGEAQKKATAGSQEQLILTELDRLKKHSFSKNYIKAGREAPATLSSALRKKRLIRSMRFCIQKFNNTFG